MFILVKEMNELCSYKCQWFSVLYHSKSLAIACTTTSNNIFVYFVLKQPEPKLKYKSAYNDVALQYFMQIMQ